MSDELPHDSPTKAKTAHKNPAIPQWLRKEWPTVKGAPVSFGIAVVGCSVFFGVMVYYIFEKGVLTQKNAIIEQKGETISMLGTKLEEARKEIEKLKADHGQSLSPLKRRTLIMAEQLAGLALEVSTNKAAQISMIYRNGFDNRVEKLLTELANNGQTTTLFRNGFYGPQNTNDVIRLSKEFQRMGTALKE
jgi:hypothetical protein